MFGIIKNKKLSKKEWQKNPVAYFCMEFALNSNMPTYAGGLGILAGDLLLETNVQQFPFVAVGLNYKKGQKNRKYLDLQEINQQKGISLKILQDENNKPVTISLPIEGRTVYVQTLIWTSGSVSLYLLDTDIEINHPEDRLISKKLYTEDRRMRIKQEILLGIGGYRMLKKLGIRPSLYHLNEGHSAFISFELIAEEMRQNKVNFTEASKCTKQKIVFSNHTLIVDGQEFFNRDILVSIIDKYSTEIGIPALDLLSLGDGIGVDSFSMTNLALRVSGKTNAVSLLHKNKAEEIWENFDIDHVTNGIHIDRWDRLCTDDTENIYLQHQKNKQLLLNIIEKIHGEKWDENTLLIGWARRLILYKRPLALFEQAEKLKKIAEKTGKEIRIVISGPFETDSKDNQFVSKLQKLSEGPLKGILVLLPEYSLELAQVLVAGTDVWLNTPMVGLEACGTSGMKAALNGSLPLSTNDGWIYEVDLKEKGWLLDNEKISDDLLLKLEKEIVPLYYNDPTKKIWKKYMKNSRELIQNDFSAKRMLEEYIEKLYIPIIKNQTNNPNAN
ncbi:MAG: alpha-glucan family phosphorylase [Parcubacteria group bacterium]|nr:alpha-glucan family phosphorylase [Parcubacteria group bacterium]